MPSWTTDKCQLVPDKFYLWVTPFLRTSKVLSLWKTKLQTIHQLKARFEVLQLDASLGNFRNIFASYSIFPIRNLLREKVVNSPFSPSISGANGDLQSSWKHTKCDRGEPSPSGSKKAYRNRPKVLMQTCRYLSPYDFWVCVDVKLNRIIHFGAYLKKKQRSSLALL